MSNYSSLCLTLIITAILLPISTIQAQNKTGNIVEYFGKEKINEISEGELVHVFDEGLVLAVNQIDDRSATFPKNPVFSAFLDHPDTQVKESELFAVDYLGEEMKWQALQTDSTHTFSDRSLRSGYLYLEYDAPKNEILLFEGSGHTQILINGLPHEGDHYDFGYSLIPVMMKKGVNTFVLSPGRFSRARARLIRPDKPVMLTSRDMTLPDILKEEDKKYSGAVRIINASERSIKGYTIHCGMDQENTATPVRQISPFQVVKTPFEIPFVAAVEMGKQDLIVELKNPKGTIVSTLTISIQVKSRDDHHKRTFFSNIDGSIQYYSVAPSTNANQDSQALFLSVHGASVEAVNQANAYQKKDWGYLIAPTNRRPFGFAWEDWGRIDAMEVLADAKKIYQPNPQKIYLTGHSMGGHGTWYLGATYPDRFAAIAPCAGYADLLGYRNSFLQRRLRDNPGMMKQYGISEKTIERMLLEEVPTPVENMITRAGNPSRTLKLIRNYLQSGVYILHGEKDNVVPTYLAQDMRERLGAFHPDFTYYEYPDGTHWYGNHSVDWPPIFDFFSQRTIPLSDEIDDFEFQTASPGVSSSSHFVEIHQQEIPFEISDIKVHREDSLHLTTKNIATFSLDARAIGKLPEGLVVDQQSLSFTADDDTVYYQKSEGKWKQISLPSSSEKGPHRYGGFKDAFNNRVVLVYGTGGNDEENEWYFTRATFDAEKFWYRANGQLPVIPDTEFDPAEYPDRNVIIYGNKDNNLAWDKMLAHSPVQVLDNQVRFGGVTIPGDQWGTYFIYPRKDSEMASIGVVSATGSRGMRSAFANNYLQNGTTFPDFLLFDDSVITEGSPGIKCAGFFGNDWSVKEGDFEWR